MKKNGRGDGRTKPSSFTFLRHILFIQLCAYMDDPAASKMLHRSINFDPLHPSKAELPSPIFENYFVRSIVPSNLNLKRLAIIQVRRSTSARSASDD